MAGKGRGKSRPSRAHQEIAPVKSTRIYEEIVRQIQALIEEGTLRSGDQLPPERVLAERFKVSRNSVREALRTLQSLGLIATRPGGGTFIQETSVESLIEPLALSILNQREAVSELFEARRLLEPSIAKLASQRATGEEVAEMERILDEQSKEIAAGRTGIAQDAAFHAAIAGSTHNRAILRLVNALMDLLAQSREETLQTPGRPERSHQDHRRILSAIKSRDGRAGQQAMLDHINAVEDLLTRIPDK